MPPRTVQVFDRPFPNLYEMIVPEPDRQWPKEVWSAEIGESEVAVFYRHFQTNTSWGKNGIPINPSDEICDVFPCLEEAKLYCLEISRAQPSVVCDIRNKSEAVIERVYNRRSIGLFNFKALTGLFIFLFVYIGLALGFVWSLSRVGRSILGTPALSPSTWSFWQWCLFLATVPVLGAAVWLGTVWLTRTNRILDFHRRILDDHIALPAEAEQLASSSNPEDRSRARELYREYYQRLSALRSRNPDSR